VTLEVCVLHRSASNSSHTIHADLAVGGYEVREVGLDPVEVGAAEDGVGLERKLGRTRAEARDGDNVVARAAGEGIFAGAVRGEVVAVRPEERFGAGVAPEEVVAGGAINRVVPELAGGSTAEEVVVRAAEGGVVAAFAAQKVGAGFAIEGVVGDPAEQIIVARPAEERVGCARSRERVGAAGPDRYRRGSESGVKGSTAPAASRRNVRLILAPFVSGPGSRCPPLCPCRESGGKR
jgi:hypothetical protein